MNEPQTLRSQSPDPSPGEPKSDTGQAEVEKMAQENSEGGVRSFCLGLGRQ